MTFVNDKNTVAILNAAAGISLRRLIVAYSLVDIIVVITRGDSRCNRRHLSSPYGTKAVGHGFTDGEDSDSALGFFM
eukprot:scaffold8341_cov66-Cyclotella_meneghiniana.AAC.1